MEDPRIDDLAKAIAAAHDVDEDAKVHIDGKPAPAWQNYRRQANVFIACWEMMKASEKHAEPVRKPDPPEPPKPAAATPAGRR